MIRTSFLSIRTTDIVMPFNAINDDSKVRLLFLVVVSVGCDTA